jgi:acyl-CoA thioester hydrolase
MTDTNEPAGGTGKRYVENFKVRWAECDPQNVVFNGSYFIYFDTAQSGLLTEVLGSWRDRHGLGVDTVLVETHVRFVAPARFEDLLEVSVTVTKIGTTSVELKLEARREETLVAEATSWYVFVDLATFKKSGLPQYARDALAEYLI